MGASPSKPNFEKYSKPQVICLGFSRTGTNSMQLALSMLLGDGQSLNVQHGGTDFYVQKNLARTYCAALEAKRKGDAQKAQELTRQATRGYVALTDMPAILLLEELLALYPDAKFVLVERNPERWAKSFAGVFDHTNAWYIPVLTAPWPRVRWLPTVVAHFQHCADTILKEAGAEPGDYGPRLLEEYNKRVKNMVPSDRLLVMSLDQGWGPLCAFLGKPVPKDPFPRMNNSQAVNQFASRMLTEMVLSWLGLAVTLAAVAIGLRISYQSVLA